MTPDPTPDENQTPDEPKKEYTSPEVGPPKAYVPADRLPSRKGGTAGTPVYPPVTILEAAEIDRRFKVVHFEFAVLAVALLIFAIATWVAFERRDDAPPKVEVRLPACAALEGTAWEGAISCVGPDDKIITPED